MRGILRLSVDSPHKGLVMLKNDSIWWRHHTFPAWFYPDTSVRVARGRGARHTHNPNPTRRIKVVNGSFVYTRQFFLYVQLSKSNRLQIFRDISYDKCIRRFCNDKKTDKYRDKYGHWPSYIIWFYYECLCIGSKCSRVFSYIPIHFWWRCSVGRQTYSNHLTPTVLCAGSVRFSLQYRME